MIEEAKERTPTTSGGGQEIQPWHFLLGTPSCWFEPDPPVLKRETLRYGPDKLRCCSKHDLLRNNMKKQLANESPSAT